jgi:tetratricopeptide (TPR) repeat protein
MVLSMARRFEEALEAARRAVELDPLYSVAFERLAEAYMGMGRHEEAITALRKAADISGGSLLWKSVLGHAYALAGRKGEAREILDELLAPSNRGKVFSEHIAWIFAGLGEKEKALQWLEAAYDARDPNMVMLKVWPAWDPLRGEPRFQALLKRMKLD